MNRSIVCLSLFVVSCGAHIAETSTPDAASDASTCTAAALDEGGGGGGALWVKAGDGALAWIHVTTTSYELHTIDEGGAHVLPSTPDAVVAGLYAGNVYYVGGSGDLHAVSRADATDVVVATNVLPTPHQLAVSDAGVLAISKDNLLFVPRTGGTAQTLMGGVFSLAADGDVAYAASNTDVYRYDLTATATSTLVAGSSTSIEGLATWNGDVYMVAMDDTGSHVERISELGGDVTEIAMSGFPGHCGLAQEIAVDASGIYLLANAPKNYADDNGRGCILRVPLAGGSVEELATDGYPYFDFAIDDGSIVFSIETLHVLSGPVLRRVCE